MRTAGIIPARLQSSRLPRKLLLSDTGKPLIQYVWEAACQSQSLDEVIIAADSEEIRAVVQGFGGRCELTGDHPSGTDRIAEVVRRCCPHTDIVVNVQGDEPEIDPAQIDQLVQVLASSNSEMATLATPITTPEELEDTSCTKVVCGNSGQALYFSRLPIPYPRDVEPASLLGDDSPWLLHLGIYAYRRKYLLELTRQSPGRLEQLEKLEQLRAIENGATIQEGVVSHRAAGIDTPEDYQQFKQRQRAA